MLRKNFLLYIPAWVMIPLIGIFNFSEEAHISTGTILRRIQ